MEAKLKRAVLRATRPKPTIEQPDGYDPGTWTENRLLFVGGEFLRDPVVMERLIPRRGKDESDVAYQERVERAFYVPFPAKVIARLIGGVMSDPPSAQVERLGGIVPDWYETWFENVSKPGATGGRRSLALYAAEALSDLMVTGRCWTLCDLPRPAVARPVSLADQERRGDREAYLCMVRPESVINWEKDRDGNLLWARTLCEEIPQLDPFGAREIVVERYTTYLPDSWLVHEFRRKTTDQQVSDDADASLVDGGTHTFGRVQLRQTLCPPGLYAMGKIGGLARALLNKICALSMSEIKNLLPELYEFSGPERSRSADARVSEVQKDPKRSVNQKRGPGYAQVRGHEDRAEYVAPPTSGYEFVQQTIRDLIGWIHDVVEVMAASNEARGAALRRSAESKAVDTSKEHIVQYAIGNVLRDHLLDVLETVAVGRGDKGLTWTVKGMEDFADVDPAGEINEATLLASIPWNSPTFEAAWRLRKIRNLMGEEATLEFMEKVQGELEARQAHQDEVETERRDQQINPPAPDPAKPEAERAA